MIHAVSLIAGICLALHPTTPAAAYADVPHHPAAPPAPLQRLSTVDGVVDGGVTSFVVEGTMRTDADHAVGFQIARDGDRVRIAFFDAVDGTPAYITDGRRLLIYDLHGRQILALDNATARVEFRWRGDNLT